VCVIKTTIVVTKPQFFRLIYTNYLDSIVFMPNNRNIQLYGGNDLEVETGRLPGRSGDISGEPIAKPAIEGRFVS